MNEIIANFVTHPSESGKLIQYLTSINANKANSIIESLKSEHYWISRNAPWKKHNQDERYLSRVLRLTRVLSKMYERNFFKPELSSLGNELERSFCDSFECWHTVYLQAYDFEWLYGDNYHACACIESEKTIVSYCEGDVVVIRCNSQTAFSNERLQALQSARTEL